MVVASVHLRFLSKARSHDYSETLCWEWTGAGKGNGYGNFVLNGGYVSAHRASYVLFRGCVPDDMDVCHKCDNRWCVNPHHLFIATRKENMEDMCAKGRGDGGRRKHLREDQVQEVVRRAHAGSPLSEISKTMGIGYHAVTAIVRGQNYGRFCE